MHTIEEHDGKPHLHDWSYLVAKALDYRSDPASGGLKVPGVGMDMGFHLVNTLSYALHGTDNQPYCVNGRNYSRSGYTLEHRWI